MTVPIRVSVGSGAAAYPVLIGAGLIETLPALLSELAPAHRYAVITDENVAPLYASPAVDACREVGLDAELFSFAPGEASKSRKSWSILTDQMLDAGFGRDSCLLAMGGGVTTDLGGFVAATFMRGIPLVQVPTSYLAMIDASVGGKTGVDVRAGKNLVGAFHRPHLVLADPLVLQTLPEGERRQGLVEAHKHGALLDADYFDWLAENRDDLLAANERVATEAVRRSVELKASVVTDDEFEGGYRKVLNLGHTVGHAVEAAGDYMIGHGTAVAVGLVTEARAGEAMGVTDVGVADRLEAALSPLCEALPESVTAQRVIDYLGVDKKAREGTARYVLLSRVGEVAAGEAWTHEIPEPVLREALDGVLALR